MMICKAHSSAQSSQSVNQTIRQSSTRSANQSVIQLDNQCGSEHVSGSGSRSTSNAKTMRLHDVRGRSQKDENDDDGEERRQRRPTPECEYSMLTGACLCACRIQSNGGPHHVSSPLIPMPHSTLRPTPFTITSHLTSLHSTTSPYFTSSTLTNFLTFQKRASFPLPLRYIHPPIVLASTMHDDPSIIMHHHIQVTHFNIAAHRPVPPLTEPTPLPWNPLQFTCGEDQAAFQSDSSLTQLARWASRDHSTSLHPALHDMQWWAPINQTTVPTTDKATVPMHY
uniref:Uncharacterized protein n=2 Tax=Echinococcus granulosus TaxID=6210 RepID=U6JF13_ECHGR|nr:hypothetical protein EgrG_000074900 [Echinococcus granulosus]CDS21917.1 hypothetical protein EgrG_000074800 [Echinococcus granulosus]